MKEIIERNASGIWIIVAAIFVVGYLVYNNHQGQLAKETDAKKAAQLEKELQVADAKNEKYKKEMYHTCTSKVGEISAVDFYRCTQLKEDSCFDCVVELEDPKLPTFCQRKIKEMTSNELSECLNEPTLPPEISSESK